MSAVVLDLATLRAVRRACRFRHVPEQPAMHRAVVALARGEAPMAAYAKASECFRNSHGQSPKGAA